MIVLEIFGVCFIVELVIVVTSIAISMILSVLDRKEKENNYKKMIQMENELKAKQKTENSDKNNIKDSKSSEPVKTKEELKDKELINDIKNNPDTLNKVLENAISEGYVDENAR